MPDPSPALIDTIARAIADTTAPGATEWWETITGVHGSQHEQPQQVEDYRRMARAALAAMPQPIGYAGAWGCDEDFLLDIDTGDLPHKTPEDAKNASDGYHVHCDLIVALVPVGDQ